MSVSCINKINRVFPWLLISALVLRSLIAPGFMLSVSAADGLGIIFCDGPVLQTADTAHHQHHDNGVDSQDTTVISPVCSQWSTSSVLVFNSGIDLLPTELPGTTIEDRYRPPAIPVTYTNQRIIRAPPATHLPV